MARPSTPLISRTATVAAALKVIDDDGIDALSMPRLARELDVKAPSLYHHFSDKDEILAAVAHAVLAATALPRRQPGHDWTEWLAQVALSVRTAVLRHRNAAPIVLRFLPRDLLTRMYEEAATYLHECGVPVERHLQILDGLETVSLGAAIAEAMRPPSRARVRLPHADPERFPALAAAGEANQLTSKQIFEQTVRSYLRGVAYTST